MPNIQHSSRRSAVRCTIHCDLELRQRALCCFAVFILIAYAQVPALAATPHTVVQNEQDNGPAISSGTLNLVLANPHGFVIVTDSRMSSDQPFNCNGHQNLYCDNSQKLFRTGQLSAMAIAGFAAGRTSKTLSLEIAAILRKKFGPTGLAGDAVFGANPLANREAIDLIGDWVNLVLEPPLTALLNTAKPLIFTEDELQGLEAYTFVVTIAGVSKDHLPQIHQIKFIPMPLEVVPLRSSNTAVRRFNREDQETKADHFIHKTAGLTDVAEDILNGNFKTKDKAINKYLRLRAAKHLDRMSLRDMRGLAIAILRATEVKYAAWVGGADEIGVFTTRKNLEWRLPPELPSTAALPPQFLLLQGWYFNKEGTDWSLRGLTRLSFQEAFMTEDEGQVVPQFFLANSFEDVTVRLDGNYFVGNHFESTTLLYDGGRVFLSGNGFLDNCILQVPSALSIPPDFPPLLADCKVIRKAKNMDDGGVVGHQLRLHYEPCPPRISQCAGLVADEKGKLPD